MPLDTCITNVGEYYSSHYLDSTFTKDVKDLVAKWKDGSQAPPRRLQRLSDLFFRAKTQALEETRLDCRWQLDGELAGWHGNLLEALGYTDRQPIDLPVEGGADPRADPWPQSIATTGRGWSSARRPSACPMAASRRACPAKTRWTPSPAKTSFTDKSTKLCDGDWSRVIGRVFTEEEPPLGALPGRHPGPAPGPQHLCPGPLPGLRPGRCLRAQGEGHLRPPRRVPVPETLCPGGESDEVLHDRLEEQSHRFAHGVTEALQFAVREAIELLANEWVEDRRRRKRSTTKLRARRDRPGRQCRRSRPSGSSTRPWCSSTGCCSASMPRPAGASWGSCPSTRTATGWATAWNPSATWSRCRSREANEEGSYFHEHLKRLFANHPRGFHPEPNAVFSAAWRAKSAHSRSVR